VPGARWDDVEPSERLTVTPWKMGLLSPIKAMEGGGHDTSEECARRASIDVGDRRRRLP
jgi:hypothetical protein